MKRAATEQPKPDTGQGTNDGNDGPEKIQPKSRVGDARLSPEFHFNIQVVLPENAPAETYDAIFRSIATHLLRHGEE